MLPTGDPFVAAFRAFGRAVADSDRYSHYFAAIGIIAGSGRGLAT
jgi:hypothetical protein